MSPSRKHRGAPRANGKRRVHAPAAPDPVEAVPGLLDRYGQVRRRVAELTGIQRRMEKKGDHREAARALRERRYLELVSRLLQPAR